MAEYISARDAILRELESAEHALKGAEASYEKDRRASEVANGRASRSYEGLLVNQRNVFRLKRALAVIEGEEE